MFRNTTRRMRAAIVTALAFITIGAGLASVASPAQAQTRCYYSKGLTVATGGCDNDGTYDTRMRIRCRVVGSYFEYDRYTVWHSRYTSWQGWVGCSDTARVRAVYFDMRR